MREGPSWLTKRILIRASPGLHADPLRLPVRRAEHGRQTVARGGTVGLGTSAGVIALVRSSATGTSTPWTKQGKALVAAGQYSSAIRVRLQAVAETPGDAHAHYYLGLAYAGIGLCGVRWIHLEEAVRLAPAYRGLRRGFGPACRGPVTRPGGAGPFDIAVPRDRQGGALQ